MRSTFKILFYANKGKEKDGIVPIMGRITINGTQCQFSCKHSIPLAMWDVKSNCAKGRIKLIQRSRILKRGIWFVLVRILVCFHWAQICRQTEITDLV